MPLRDHFRPPVSKQASWEGFHGMWPASIVQQLRKRLPPGYVAEPRVHLGTLIETDPPDEYEYEVRIFDLSGNERWSRPSNLSVRPTRIDRSRVRPSSPSVRPCSARGSR